jgi:hypothetical protein
MVHLQERAALDGAFTMSPGCIVAFFGIPRDGFPFITKSPQRSPHTARVGTWGINASDDDASRVKTEIAAMVSAVASGASGSAPSTLHAFRETTTFYFEVLFFFWL